MDIYLLGTVDTHTHTHIDRPHTVFRPHTYIEGTPTADKTETLVAASWRA